MKYALIPFIAASLLVSACGGGGGGAVVSPDASLNITSANAEQVAKVAYQSANGSRSFGENGGDFGFVLGPVDGNFAKPGGDSLKLQKGNAGNSQVPVPPTTTPCAVSGSTTISGNIADPVTPTLTAGDFFVTEFSACDDGLGEIADGRSRTDIITFSGDFFSEFFELAITMTLTNFQLTVFEDQSTTPTDTVLSNGDVTVSLNTLQSPFISSSISGNSMDVSSNDGFESLTNYAATQTIDGTLFPAPYTSSASGTLDSSRIAGVIRYSNPVEFSGLGADFPSAGEFLVVGSNSSLRLIADNNVDVRILIDLGDDGTVDETIVTTWQALTAEAQ